RIDVDLRHGRRTLAQSGAVAVRAGVATADDDDVLPGRHDLVVDGPAGHHAVVLDEVVHRGVDPAELAAGDRQLPRHGRTHGEHDGVVAFQQFLPAQRVLAAAADVDARPESGALGLHLLQPPV